MRGISDRSPRDGDAKPVVQTLRRLVLSATSQRLTKSEATEPTLGFSPVAMRRSTPRMYAPAAEHLCSGEKKRNVNRHASKDSLLDGM